MAKIKQTFKYLTLCGAIFALIGCNPVLNSSSSSSIDLIDSSSTIIDTGSTSNPSTSEDKTTSSEDNITSEQDSSTSVTPHVVGYDVIDKHGAYQIGDKFKNKADLHFYEVLSDDTYLDISNKVTSKIKKIIPPNNGSMVATGAFTYAGRHEVLIMYSYNNEVYYDSILVNVLSGFDVDYTAKEINITLTPNAYIGSLFVPNNELKFDVTWENNLIEHCVYDKNQTGYELCLYETDDGSKKNLINEKIIEGKSYTFEIKITKNGVFARKSLEVLTSYGFIKLDNLTITAQDIVPTYSTPIGTLNVLVIPVELEKTGFSDAQSWTKKDIERTKVEMFGEKANTFNGWNSLKTYYETASLDQLKIGGMVADLYTETDPALTMKDINADPTLRKLQTLIQRATAATIKAHPEIDWSTYDLNNDGCLDATHIITNCGAKSVEWGDPLWPHFTHTNHFGTHEVPDANAYSLSSLGHFESARTQIHEQGHMLGLQDYYDYTPYTRSDYIGGLDMQDMNVLDWNSFSKMEVGWVKPYVIDGTQSTTRITMSAASLNGDCLVIPANFNTYNQSAFDEYFLLELFSPYGNNAMDWYNCWDYSGLAPKKVDLGEYGVRLYHVDARLWNYESSQDIDSGYEVKTIGDINNLKYEELDIGTNNSKDATSYASPSPTTWHDYKLLTLIQKGKVDTFSTGKTLSKEDLFLAGDEFNFDDYSHFLSKQGKASTTMDNGEVFPYTIKFINMSKDKVTIEVSMR